MLNLRYFYEDAVRCMEHSKELRIAPLPATVFMLQADVINSYRYALTHYLTVPLDARFLQNSSMGTPYQKWAHVTNEDFMGLSFSLHNLLRYTSRLFHETAAVPLRRQRRYDEMNARSNAYTSPIGEIHAQGRMVGVTVHPDEHLSIHSIRLGPPAVKTGMRWSEGKPPIYFEISGDRETLITKDEYMFHISTIREERIDIRDRSALATIQHRGQAELQDLVTFHAKFTEVSRVYARQSEIFTTFTHLNAGDWI